MVANYDTFVGCFSLETGGKIVGWLNFIVGVLLTLFGVAKFMSQFSYLSEPHFRSNRFENIDPVTRSVDAIIWFLVTIVGFVIIYAAVQLVDGSHERKSRKIQPMIGLYSIALVFSAASNFVAWPLSLLVLVVNFYILMFLVSLYSKLDEEEKAAQEPVQTVTITQPVVANEGPSLPNDPAILTSNPNTFECYNLPPTYNPSASNPPAVTAPKPWSIYNQI